MAFARHPIFGLYTYVAVFYLHPPSRWWGAFLPDLRWSLLAALVTLIAVFRLPDQPNRQSWYSATPAKWLIVFSGWVWIQSLWAMSPVDQSDLVILYTKYILLFYLVYRLIDTPQRVRDFLIVNLIGCAYLGWLGYSTPVSGRLEGVGGPGIDEANALAMQLAVALITGAMIIIAEKRWRFWLCLLCLPLVLNTIVLAGSRSAFLAVLVAGVVLWWMKPGEYRKLFYSFAALGIVLMGILAHDIFWERIGTLKATVDETQEMDTSAESRLVLIEAQWEMAKLHPFGAGHRGTEVLSVSYLDPKYLARRADGSLGARSSHNTFMTALVEQGIPGAVIFVMLWFWCFRATRQINRVGTLSSEVRTDVAGVAGALTVVFVAGMFVDYLKAEIQIWLFALLASLQAQARSESQSRLPIAKSMLSGNSRASIASGAN